MANFNSINAYINDLNGRENELPKAIERAVLDTHAKMSQRIFDKGENSKGKTFRYTGNPGVVGGDLPKAVNESDFQPFNKAQRSKSGKKGYYGKFFDQGYKGYRKFAGRNTAFVDWKLSGDLQSDFRGGVGENQTPKPTKINDTTFNIQFSRQENIEKSEYIDERYDDVFEISDKEAKSFAKTLQNEINFILAG